MRIDIDDIEILHLTLLSISMTLLIAFILTQHIYMITIGSSVFMVHYMIRYFVDNIMVKEDDEQTYTNANDALKS